MTYQIALNYNNAAGLQDMRVQPKCEGLEWPSESEEYAGDGTIYRNGGMIADLEYGFLTKADMASILADLDLVENESREITISLPDNKLRVFRNYNAIVKSPNPPNDGRLQSSIWRDVVFHLYNIRRI